MKPIRSDVIQAVLCSWLLFGLGRGAWAHSETLTVPSGDPTSELCERIVAVALLTWIGYFALRSLLAFLEKRRPASGIEKWGRRALSVATVGLAITVWQLTTPPLTANKVVNDDVPQHGGQIESIGNNHVELAVHGSSLALYIMGITVKVSAPIQSQYIWAVAKPSEGGNASVLLQASHQSADPSGEASVFTGTLPSSYTNEPLIVAVKLPLGGRQQEVDFPVDMSNATAQSVSVPHDTSPVRVVAAEPDPAEKQLFLTPGGIYTAADIAANGSTTPELKYAGLMANHHLNPKPGQLICPITRTVANPKFWWIVGGKKYLFCCPPCIAEFVKEAKETPNEIKPPDAYIQQ